jgi:hypothetical protein
MADRLHLIQGELHLNTVLVNMENIMGDTTPNLIGTANNTGRRASDTLENSGSEEEDEQWTPRFEHMQGVFWGTQRIVEPRMRSVLEPRGEEDQSFGLQDSMLRRTLERSLLSLSSTYAPPINRPPGMVVSFPGTQRSMFFGVTLSHLYVIAGTEQLQNSSWDGKPVLRSIYAMPLTMLQPSQWSLVFDGGTIAAEIVQIQSCTSIIQISSTDASNQGIVACSFTDIFGMVKVFKLDIRNSHSFSILWRNSSMNLTASSMLPPPTTAYQQNASSPIARLRFRSEIVPMPINLYGEATPPPSYTGYPDLFMGIPINSEYSCIARLRLYTRIGETGEYSMLSCKGVPSSSSSSETGNLDGGLMNFVSMAFTASAQDLFAVDEQPSLWRWKRDESTTSGFTNSPVVSTYIHPMQSSVWKVVMMSNSRLVLATDASISLWTQCSPCPEGTVTSGLPSSESVRQRCLCPAGTFNNLVDFRSACTMCTSPGGACTGGYYRTMQNPVCPEQGYTYDGGCGRCTTQADCYPNKLATGEPCTGHTLSNTVNCTVCPNNCVTGESFVSNKCAVDGYSRCTSCRDVCTAHRYKSSRCRIDQDMQCKDCNQTCPGGMFLNRTCDGTTEVDTSECKRCDALSLRQCQQIAGNYSKNYYVNISMCWQNTSILTPDKLCKECDICPEGYWEKSPCTEFSNTVCRKCTVCNSLEDYGTFQAMPCTKWADTVCKNCTVCKPVIPR